MVVKLIKKFDQMHKPTPPPVKTNDFIAVWVGIALWLIALVLVAVFPELLGGLFAADSAVLVCLIGIGLGILGLIYLQFYNQKRNQTAETSEEEQPSE